MSDFNKFKNALNRQFKRMEKHQLFRSKVTKDDLWDTYLDSFPEGTNEIYKEKREYDCQCCKQFIRAVGNTIAIDENNNVMSIWDIKVEGYYQEVADALSKLVKSKGIADVFLHYERKVGTDHNNQLLENKKIKTWNHFYHELDNSYIKDKIDIPSLLSDKRSNKETLQRALEEITIDAIDNVLELIEQKSLYRGDENKSQVVLLRKNKKAYDKLTENKDEFCWATSLKIQGASKVRNTAIGTLLVDLSEGKELDYAVASFESKVAPSNYKRTTALVTKSMIENAKKKANELGIESALERRYATKEDISVNNVLFADRNIKKSMSDFDSAFDSMDNETTIKLKNLDKVEEVSIDTFINDILPKATSIELMIKNNHTNNFMSLIAPVNEDSNSILKWNNNFSWSYNGEVTDSMKERVAKLGGNVTGVLRYSIQWNDGDDNQNDFDAHCIEPNGNLIYYSNKGIRHLSSGMLDVDIVNPRNEVAVENITWTDKNKMQTGYYKFIVNNYSHNGGKTGFTAEIEYDGVIHSYAYNKELRDKEKVQVAKVNFSRKNGLKFIESLPSTESTKEIWGITTNNFRKVSMIMNSPNFWDNQTIGNKHLFFILDGCLNEDSSRGFYNEFLRDELHEHRKVFEVLGSKMKVKESDNQLSGVGFSTTKRNSILCKVSGSFSRIINIKF